MSTGQRAFRRERRHLQEGELNMHETWGQAARKIIERVLSTMPGASIKEKQVALRAAYPFGERRYWPYRAWRRQVRIALGLQKDRTRGARSPHASLDTPLFDSVNESHVHLTLPAEERRNS